MSSANPIHVTSPYLSRRRQLVPTSVRLRGIPSVDAAPPSVVARPSVVASPSHRRVTVSASRRRDVYPGIADGLVCRHADPVGLAVCVATSLLFRYVCAAGHPPPPPSIACAVVCLAASALGRRSFCKGHVNPLLPLVASHGPVRARVFWGCEDHS